MTVTARRWNPGPKGYAPAPEAMNSHPHDEPLPFGWGFVECQHLSTSGVLPMTVGDVEVGGQDTVVDTST